MGHFFCFCAIKTVQLRLNVFNIKKILCAFSPVKTNKITCKMCNNVQRTKTKSSKYNLDDLKSIFRRDLDAREPYLIGYQSAKMELKNFNLVGF